LPDALPTGHRGGGRAGPVRRARHAGPPRAVARARADRPRAGCRARQRGAVVKPAPFDYQAAGSAAEAVDLLARHGDDAKVLAGGQSLVPMLNMRLARPGVLVDVNPAAELDYVPREGGVLAVGALAPHP